MAGKKRKAARRRTSGLVVFITVALVAVVSAVGVGMFFRVTELEFSGNFTKYTEAELESASGVEIGDSLFFTRKSTVRERIMSQMPYAGDVAVKKQYPGKLIVTIDESSAAAYLRADKQLWLLDKDMRALEITDAAAAAGYIRVRGLETASVTAGRPVIVDETEKTALRCASDVLAALAELGLLQDVSELDVSNVGAVTLEYLGRFTVKLGTGENVLYKLSRLPEIILTLQDTDTGILDISGDGQSYLIPYKTGA